MELTEEEKELLNVNRIQSFRDYYKAPLCCGIITIHFVYTKKARISADLSNLSLLYLRSFVFVK